MHPPGRARQARPGVAGAGLIRMVAASNNRLAGSPGSGYPGRGSSTFERAAGCRRRCRQCGGMAQRTTTWLGRLGPGLRMTSMVNRPGFGGGSGYWIPTSSSPVVWALSRFGARAGFSGVRRDGAPSGGPRVYRPVHRAMDKRWDRHESRFRDCDRTGAQGSPVLEVDGAAHGDGSVGREAEVRGGICRVVRQGKE